MRGGIPRRHTSPETPYKGLEAPPYAVAARIDAGERESKDAKSLNTGLGVIDCDESE